MARRPIRTAYGVAAVVAAFVLSSCAGIPTSGPVVQAEEVPGEAEPPPLFDPSGPRVGATPTEIVSGFFDAMRAYPIATDVAKEFLTPDAAKNWDPLRQTVVYTSIETTPVRPRTIDVRTQRQAVLDRQGSYRPVSSDAKPQVQRLRLRQERGEWRVVNPPNTLYVDSYYFTVHFEPFSLYFIDPSGEVMVPEPVYLPTEEQPATRLVRGVLNGPPRSWSGQLRTAAPSMDARDVPVPIGPDGVAEVRLPTPVLDLKPERRRQLSAQLVWTLAQVPEVDGVRILVDGAPLEVRGVPTVQHIDLWSEYDQSAVDARGDLYALRDGRIVRIDDREVVGMPQRMWGSTDWGVRSFEVALAHDGVLAVSSDGSQLLSGALSQRGGVPATVDYQGTDLAQPVATRFGGWLVMDRGPRASRLLAVSRDRQVRTVPIGALAGQRVESLTISPDGMRFAALTRPWQPDGLGDRQIMLGRVHLDANGQRVVRLEDARRFAVASEELTDIRAVEWLDGTTLGVLGRQDEGSYDLSSFLIDGSEVVELVFDSWRPSSAPLVRLATSTQPADKGQVLVLDAQGTLWRWDEGNGQWLEVKPGRLSAPSFPG